VATHNGNKVNGECENLGSLGSTLEKPNESVLRKWLINAGGDRPNTTPITALPTRSNLSKLLMAPNGLIERFMLKRRLIQRDASRPTENPDVDWVRAARWNEIGWEVFERKALLLAAASDLRKNGVENALQLAATDIFVEKAQRILTTRANYLYFFGAITSLCAVGLLLFGAWLLFHANVLDQLKIKDSKEWVSTAYLTVFILKSTTAGGFLGGVVYLLASISRALLHEATVLYSRRHSLRFGRLFVYLMSKEMTREDLEAIFQWNAEFSTAFKDINASNIGQSPVIKALETVLKPLSEVVKPLAEALAKERPPKDGEVGCPPK